MNSPDYEFIKQCYTVVPVNENDCSHSKKKNDKHTFELSKEFDERYLLAFIKSFNRV